MWIDSTIITLVFLVISFILLSGLLAAVDAAVLSVTRPEIEESVQLQQYGAKRLRVVKHGIRDAVVVIVIVTNTINVLGPVLISHQAFALFSSHGVVILTVGLTLGTIVFSEIIPKAIGNHFAPLIARFSAPVILLGERILLPLVIPLSWLTRWLTPGTRQIGTEPQIRSLARVGHEAGHIETDEHQMILRAFVLNDQSARDIMTPMHRVRSISGSNSISQAAAEVQRSEFSRYPVFGATVDDVQGVLLARELFQAMLQGETERSVLSLVVKPILIDADTRNDDLLVMFRHQHMHLAVVQSGRKTLGIVTLEDVLEQLVGQIDDEKDTLPTSSERLVRPD